MTGYVGIGVHPCLSPQTCHSVHRSFTVRSITSVPVNTLAPLCFWAPRQGGWKHPRTDVLLEGSGWINGDGINGQWFFSPTYKWGILELYPTDPNLLWSLPCDIGGAIWSHGWCLFLLKEELFGTPESSKSQHRWGSRYFPVLFWGRCFLGIHLLFFSKGFFLRPVSWELFGHRWIRRFSWDYGRDDGDMPASQHEVRFV